MRRWKLSLLVAVALIALARPVAGDTYSPRVGERHVNFTLPAIDDGRPISLEQLRGKKVLLVQFASW
ncbi:MAG: hypothetical protein AB7F89_06995 [Pirellulaceae bacterium]